ncbi:hypothetical protein MKEN_00397500 [Mycena kentingensis (nom. inval.)]|nr:hypothetical protein MKEN_00397500 [Mycena kentingensis (nom. inval.)]
MPSVRRRRRLPDPILRHILQLVADDTLLAVVISGLGERFRFFALVTHMRRQGTIPAGTVLADGIIPPGTQSTALPSLLRYPLKNLRVLHMRFADLGHRENHPKVVRQLNELLRLHLQACELNIELHLRLPVHPDEAENLRRRITQIIHTHLDITPTRPLPASEPPFITVDPNEVTAGYDRLATGPLGRAFEEGTESNPRQRARGPEINRRSTFTLFLPAWPDLCAGTAPLFGILVVERERVTNLWIAAAAGSRLADSRVIATVLGQLKPARLPALNGVLRLELDMVHVGFEDALVAFFEKHRPPWWAVLPVEEPDAAVSPLNAVGEITQADVPAAETKKRKKKLRWLRRAFKKSSESNSPAPPLPSTPLQTAPPVPGPAPRPTPPEQTLLKPLPSSPTIPNPPPPKFASSVLLRLQNLNAHVRLASWLLSSCTSLSMLTSVTLDLCSHNSAGDYLVALTLLAGAPRLAEVTLKFHRWLPWLALPPSEWDTELRTVTNLTLTFDVDFECESAANPGSTPAFPWTHEAFFAWVRATTGSWAGLKVLFMSNLPWPAKRIKALEDVRAVVPAGVVVELRHNGTLLESL